LPIRISAEERLQRLNRTAIEQIKVLVAIRSIKGLQPGENKLLTSAGIAVVEGKR